MENEKKTLWVKILNFIIEVLKLIIAIFGAVELTNLI